MPVNKIVVIDTSILCALLEVPGKETCGPDDDRWDKARVDEAVENLKKEHATFIIPLAVIIETGNHIAQSKGAKKKSAIDGFADIIHMTLDEQSPWGAFLDQTELWSYDKVAALIDRWKELAVCNHSLGDASIVDVANFYSSMKRPVEIFTADAGLKAHEPVAPKREMERPRRYRK